MRLQFKLLYALGLMAVFCLWLGWYSRPSLLKVVIKGISELEGDALRRAVKEVPELSAEDRLLLSDALAEICGAEHEARLRNVGYQWFQDEPAAVEAWMDDAFRPPEGSRTFDFYGDVWPDAMLQGILRANSVRDYKAALSLINRDRYYWDDGSVWLQLEPINRALEQEEFSKLIDWFESLEGTPLFEDLVSTSCKLMTEKNPRRFLAWVGATERRLRAEGGGLYWFDSVCLSWPKNDLSFFEEWIVHNLDIVSHVDCYLRRLPNADVVRFGDRLLDKRPTIVVTFEILNRIHQIDPGVAISRGEQLRECWIAEQAEEYPPGKLDQWLQASKIRGE